MIVHSRSFYLKIFQNTCNPSARIDFIFQYDKFTKKVANKKEK